ncbi:hypothetical protein DRO03_01370 [Methanosarcinales archaeon]|nr:MAG: hypothetical protein DRO03_01370 [Methanosarcinales archaeon]
MGGNDVNLEIIRDDSYNIDVPRTITVRKYETDIMCDLDAVKDSVGLNYLKHGKELDELIQQLKTNSLGAYAEQLENARKSNGVNQIKSILSKLKNVVSGSAEMVGMIATILDLLKNSSS